MAGPGLRFCIWVQGCSRHCKDCMAQETWPFDGGTAMEIEALYQQIISVSGIEGITLLGGEPFEQPEAAATLAERVKAAGLSVVAFTGFTHDALLAYDHAQINRLLCATDLLIDGSFRQEQFDLSRPWVGSSNQRYIFLSDRYSEKDLLGIKNQIEVRISPHGTAFINGMGNFSKIKKLL